MTDKLVLAELQGVHGVRGWLKVRPCVEDPDLLVGAPALELTVGPGMRPAPAMAAEVTALRQQGRGWLLKLVDVDDRTRAESLRGWVLSGPASLLPEVPPGEYYWRDLVGLEVYNTEQQQVSLLGVVDHLLETGANDVLVVKPTTDSVDKRERLIPWSPGDVVTRVDLAGGTLHVEWYKDV
jgi:16S rRNA processing protein RimM